MHAVDDGGGRQHELTGARLLIGRQSDRNAITRPRRATFGFSCFASKSRKMRGYVLVSFRR